MTDDLIPIIPVAEPGTTTSTVNRLEVRVVGMSRSGNHAIIGWILSQAIGGMCFLNCGEPKTNPFRTNRPLRPGGDGFSANIPRLDLAAETAGRHLPKDLLVHSYEDTFLGPFARADVEAQHDRWLGTSQRRGRRPDPAGPVQPVCQPPRLRSWRSQSGRRHEDLGSARAGVPGAPAQSAK